MGCSQEEVCEDHFEKSCYIEYKTEHRTVQVKFCHETMVKDCDAPAPDVCETIYTTECTTEREPHEMENDEAVCTEEIVEKCEDVEVYRIH